MSLKTTIKIFDRSLKGEVSAKWMALESRSNCSVFLSWQWIGNWLDLVTGKIILVECYQGNKVVGLGFFVEHYRKAFGLFPVKQWYLHRTGIQKQDQIWIEYNDFLLDKECADIVRNEMVKSVYQSLDAPKEFIIGLSTDDVKNSFLHANFECRELVSTKGYLVNSELISDNYAQSILSKNTRQQIQRSNKLLELTGDLQFSIVTQCNEINEILPDIAKLHKQRWQTTVEGSGFSNVLFYHFFQNFFSENKNQKKTTQIAMLTLNDNKLGYLVNFVYRDKVYFYLSALRANENNKIKVGLLLHSEAIKYYFSKKMVCYDFLGGEARYKSSLSSNTYQLSLSCFSCKSPILLFENILRQLKNAIKYKISRTQ